MGAANGEVIREPFDTKPSDQWVGCLLISLQSKGVVRRSHVVGYQEMYEWVAEPGLGPCLPHRAPCVRILLGTITLMSCPGAHWGPVGMSPTPLRCCPRGDGDSQGRPSLSIACRKGISVQDLLLAGHRFGPILPEGTQTKQSVPAAPSPGSWMSCFCLAGSIALLSRGKPWKEEKVPSRFPQKNSGRWMPWGGMDRLCQGGWLGILGCPPCGCVHGAQPGQSRSPLGFSPPEGDFTRNLCYVATSGQGVSRGDSSAMTEAPR